MSTGSSNDVVHRFAWDSRHVARQRAGLVAGAGLTVIAMAMGVASPGLIALVIVLTWLLLLSFALARTVRIAVSLTVRRSGIEVQPILGPRRFARWDELRIAQLPRTSAGRKLHVTLRSGASFAEITERMSSFDELGDLLRAHLV